MKENHISKNRHKYYLKCHLIFCIKYRRKILYGKFDDDIKKELQRIADNSDFDIDIMETDKDHIHFLISYPPKLSVASMVRKLKQESTVFAWHLYEYVETIFLERKNIMVGRLFCLLNRRSQSEHH